MQHPFIDLLASAVERFAALTAEVDPTLPVPACPDWVVVDLVEHLSSVHSWARHAILEGNPEAPLLDSTPADLSLLPGWYRGHAEALLAVLRSTPEDAEAWTFGRGAGTAGWWQRRQTHETLLHTRDLLAAAGREDEWHVDPALAWDALDEVASMFYPRQVRLARCDMLTTALRLVPTDLPAGLLAETGPVVIGDVEDVVELTGTAGDLLLQVWKRLPCTDERAAGVLAHAITP
ncbi:maleylpyruvate isomerase family mycothiol-dependent enzyme [Nocardioides bruguierae]|uniref:maleylpyruvate isomerase family mycothiol-dependent enzyme n=1 Tax=Nocardioides bruguierae TaxID=2945102 RepID=UPI00202129F7|nr:maleylpyruvate isomerase family mycothiol-dependent enzyme [Nocardioides bruguierae]MCL8027271.1 maleylpyruvate isomerase family mycothiol-dependent enzyme [Nocardioides bruguierae]